jgi:hypothetical protein
LPGSERRDANQKRGKYDANETIKGVVLPVGLRGLGPEDALRR